MARLRGQALTVVEGQRDSACRMAESDYGRAGFESNRRASRRPVAEPTAPGPNPAGFPARLAGGEPISPHACGGNVGWRDLGRASWGPRRRREGQYYRCEGGERFGPPGGTTNPRPS